MKKKCVWLSLTTIAFIFQIQPLRADYKQAVIYYQQGKYDKAIQELKPDLDKNPEWEFGHRLLGLCYVGLGNNALAVQELSRAVQLKSTAFSTYYGLAQAYFNMRKYESCIGALNQGETLADKEKNAEVEKAKLYRLRGSAYFRTGRFNEAVDDLTNAIRRNPSDWSDFSMLGAAYMSLNRTDEGIEALERSLAMKPGQNAVKGLLGKAYLDKGASSLSEKKYGSAIRYLLKAKDYSPQNGYVYYNLAEAYLFEKRYKEAERALDQTIKLLPDNANAYERLGFIYEKQKKWDLALDAYRKAERMNPSKDTKKAIERVNENKKIGNSDAGQGETTR